MIEKTSDGKGAGGRPARSAVGRTDPDVFAATHLGRRYSREHGNGVGHGLGSSRRAGVGDLLEVGGPVPLPEDRHQVLLHGQPQVASVGRGSAGELLLLRR